MTINLVRIWQVLKKRQALARLLGSCMLTPTEYYKGQEQVLKELIHFIEREMSKFDRDMCAEEIWQYQEKS